MTTKVKLRQRAVTKGRLSLYLDYYPAIINPKTGKRSRKEFLNIYILEKPKTALEKQSNKEKQQLAEQIRQRRENDVNKPEIYNAFEAEQLRIKEIGDRNFLEYFLLLAQKRIGSNHATWMSAYNYLKAFTNNHLQFKDVNKKFCNDYKEYLLSAKSIRYKTSKLSQNSAAAYFMKFKVALKQAYREGLLTIDINSQFDMIKPIETKRNFLTIEELNTLAKTEFEHNVVKQAALFSALTGLRFSDIKKLVWEEVREDEKGYSIQFVQQKTKGVEFLPISEQAFRLLGERRKDKDIVFVGLNYLACQNKSFKDWIKRAGVGRDITFHVARHVILSFCLKISKLQKSFS